MQISVAISYVLNFKSWLHPYTVNFVAVNLDVINWDFFYFYLFQNWEYWISYCIFLNFLITSPTFPLMGGVTCELFVFYDLSVCCVERLGYDALSARTLRSNLESQNSGSWHTSIELLKTSIYMGSLPICNSFLCKESVSLKCEYSTLAQPESNCRPRKSRASTLIRIAKVGMEISC